MVFKLSDCSESRYVEKGSRQPTSRWNNRGWCRPVIGQLEKGGWRGFKKKIDKVKKNKGGMVGGGGMEAAQDNIAVGFRIWFRSNSIL